MLVGAVMGCAVKKNSACGCSKGLSSVTPSLRTIRTMSFGLLSSVASRCVIPFSTGVVSHLVAVPLIRDERPLTIAF